MGRPCGIFNALDDAPFEPAISVGFADLFMTPDALTRMPDLMALSVTCL